MEKLEIRILPQAAMKLSRQAEWYFNKCGKSFSITLIKNTVSDIEAIASMPTIGRNIPTRGKRDLVQYSLNLKLAIIHKGL
jgi:plasmid stabilization system protein ParE